ncbi:MAG: hypothetical protein HC841_03490 [Verrucomicrobiae bacterium]|nr:hypothetical protein [Verrucomicrobiae bacterium]
MTRAKPGGRAEQKLLRGLRELILRASAQDVEGMIAAADGDFNEIIAALAPNAAMLPGGAQVITLILEGQHADAQALLDRLLK